MLLCYIDKSIILLPQNHKHIDLVIRYSNLVIKCKECDIIKNRYTFFTLSTCSNDYKRTEFEERFIKCVINNDFKKLEK